MSTIEAVLDEFRAIIAPEYRNQIRLTEPYYMRECQGRQDWPKGYREVWNVDPLHGVYLIFDANERLLYVGTAVKVGKRLNEYFGYAEDRTLCEVIDAWLKDKDARIVRAIILSDEAPAIQSLAPALERFLIAKLDPEGNTHHRVKPVAL